MARHVVHRRNGQVDEYQELPDTEHLEPDVVTVTFPDGRPTTWRTDSAVSASNSRKPESSYCDSKTATTY